MSVYFLEGLGTNHRFSLKRIRIADNDIPDEGQHRSNGGVNSGSYFKPISLPKVREISRKNNIADLY